MPQTPRSPPEPGDALRPRPGFHAEDALFRAAKTVVDFAFYLLDPDGNVATWNEGAERLKGYKEHEILGHHFSCLYTSTDQLQGKPEQNLAEATIQGRIEEEGWRRRKDGTQFWAHVVLTAIRDSRGKLVAFSKVTQDRTEARRAEVMFRGLMESAPDAMVILDKEGSIVLVNSETEKLFGFTREELTGKGIEVLVPEHLRTKHVEHRKTYYANPRTRPMGQGLELSGVRKDGTCIPVEVALSSLESEDGPLVAAAVRDVSERKKLEEHLRAVQRMESIGRLASGIAHDFNNFLTVISGNVELLLADRSVIRAHGPQIEAIRDASERAATITRQLLAFGRGQVLQPKVFDLNSVLTHMTQLLCQVTGDDIDLRVTQAEDVCSVRADPGQIEQVIMNLAINARDAMPRGGTLRIETSIVDLEGKAHTAEMEIGSGPHVLLAVSDSGHGMDTETLHHIFEPFFTTKPQGEGSGLGLATVHGIVKQSGGAISVRSKPGRGTTFEIYLPTFDEKTAGDPREDLQPHTPTAR